METDTVYCRNHEERTSTLCGQNAVSPNVTVRVTSSLWRILIRRLGLRKAAQCPPVTLPLDLISGFLSVLQIVNLASDFIAGVFGTIRYFKSATFGLVLRSMNCCVCPLSCNILWICPYSVALCPKEALGEEGGTFAFLRLLI
jgi:hypothetical protein